MKLKPARFFSVAFQTCATLLAAYGLFGLSRFAWYSGEYFDDSLIGFDNGFYPFFWGVVFLVTGQLLRLQGRRGFMGAVAIAGLLVFSFKLMTLPKLTPIGQALYPSVDLLKDLIIVCVILVGLTLADKRIQQGIDWVVVRPFRALRRKA